MGSGTEPTGASSAEMSFAEVTSTASASRIRRCGVADKDEVMGPGTAMTGRPIASAQDAVFLAPDRLDASTTTTAPARAAMMRLRARKAYLVGRLPGGSSEARAPLLITASARR